jgi:hypothetical protein
VRQAAVLQLLATVEKTLHELPAELAKEEIKS